MQQFRRFRYALIGAAVLLATGFTALVVLAKVYDAEVKAKLIGALNEQLLAPVSVSDIDLTLVARFPRASVRLTNVLAREVRYDGQPPDTLLHANALFLEFSLWDLFRGEYTVQRIHGDEVRLYPALDDHGRENYLIWKTDSTASSPLELRSVTVNGLVSRFRDVRSRTAVEAFSRSLTLRGRFSELSNDLVLNGDVGLRYWDHAGKRVLHDREAQVRLDMVFGGSDGAFRITKGELVMNDVSLDLTLEHLPGPTGAQLDLRANGLGLDLARTVALLPDPYALNLKRYGMKGELDLALHYSGPLEGPGPALSIAVQVQRGRITEKKSGVTLQGVRGAFALDLTPQGTPKSIVITGFSATSSSGSIHGNWRSNGLTNATVKADLQSDIALADLMRFAQVDTLEQVGGRLTVDSRIEGRLRDLADVKASDLRTLRISGSATLRDATLKIKGLRHKVEHLNANMELTGNDATIDRFDAEIHGNALVLKGTLRNLVPYLLFDGQHLSIAANASSPRIDLGTLLSNGEPSRPGDTGYSLSLPATIDLDLQASVDELVFEDFTATAIRGTLHMKDRTLRISPLSFNTASGAVLGTLELDARGSGINGYPLAIQATCQDIDITALFKEFRDFGQDFIGHRHLSGRTTARITLQAPLSNDMRMDMARLVCGLDITLTDGAIRGHQPLLEIAEHVRKNKLIAPFVNTGVLRDRLADVRFSRLENSISIRDGAVHVPAMVVKSSAMDIELSGTHWFDDRIDHHINFRLSDLFKMGKPTRDEFGPIADDGTGMRIFLHMYGTASDPQFANDGAMAANRRKKQIEQEKAELRTILREDLGLFRGKGDKSTTPSTAPQPDVRILIEPEGTDTGRTAGTIAVQKERRRQRDRDKEEPVRERIIIED